MPRGYWEWAGHRRRLRGREALPGDEQEQLAVFLAQPGHRPQRFGGLAAGRRVGRQLGPQRLGEAPAEPGPTALGPVQVVDYPTRDGVEPEPGVGAGRDCLEPPPGDEESLGDDVGGALAILDPSQRVAEHRASLLAVELGEACLRELAPERACLGLPLRHPLYMSGPDRTLRRDQRIVVLNAVRSGDAGWPPAMY